MKKLFFVMVVAVFLSSSASAQFLEGDFIGKVNLGIAGKFKSSKDLNYEKSFDVSSGIDIAAEYVFSVANIIQIGGGAKYLLPREVIDAAKQGNTKASYLPVYALITVKPFLLPVYFKANLGWNLFTNLDYDLPGVKVESYGRTYWALGAGYELPLGLLLELSFNVYNAQTTFKGGGIDEAVDTSYYNLGLTAGYKFSNLWN
jgi:hypothetical protein